MNLAEFRLQAEPGDGVTAYFGKAALLALDIPASGSPFFDELLAVVHAAATPDDGGPGRSLVRQMARLITRTAAADTVPFGLLADTGDSIVVLLHGSMVMTLTPLMSTQTAGASPEVVSGSDSTTWVDRLIHEDFESLVLAGQGHAASTPVMPMAAGVSAGAAIHLVRAPISDVAEAPAQPESQFLSISLSGADVSALIALPRLGEEATPDPAPSVVGGRLLLTDGSVVALSGGLLLGREPQNAPEVADGSLSALALPDADRAVSRVHARICVDDAGVTIEDLGSANGTALAAPETSEWVALRPGEPLTLLPGARIRIGEQELTFVVDPSPVPPPPPAASPEAPPAAATFPLDRPAEQHDGIGDYEFVRPLGSGERGAYFLAIPPARLQLDAQFVAVKVFRGATSDDAFRRATRELRAFAAAQSQYLVKVHDAGQDSGQLFYSMDYISGGSLAEPVTPLDEAGIIKSVAQAARAAHALHEVGVVHQAIMPKNILLGDTKAYLADLGLAQLISQESFSTSLGDFEGLEFLDPSILTGARGTRATDVWSLAATLHRALTGSAIYEGLSADPLLAIRAVLTQQVAVSESLSPELAAVIRACLDPDLSLRPATALELAKQLESLIPV